MYKILETYRDKKGIRIFVGEDSNKSLEIYVVKKYRDNSFDSLTIYSDPHILLYWGEAQFLL